MKSIDILQKLDLVNNAISVDFDYTTLSEGEAFVINEVKNFGIDRVYFNSDVDTGNSFPAIFLKKVTSFDIDTLKQITEIQRKIWNYKKVLFLYVYSDVEIRIYNCSEKPIVVTNPNINYEKELKKLEIASYSTDKENLEELINLFSRIAIDTGVIWTLEEAQFIRDKINLQKRIDKFLIESLKNTSNQLEKTGLELNFIHKIILRSLFLLYLEDRKATDETLYSQYKEDAKSYFDILESVEATYKLYERLEEDFNGNVFSLDRDSEGNISEKISKEQLQIIKKCFLIGNDNSPQRVLFEDWRLFDFSIIQIELLSEIYENFLFKTDPELKKESGTFYTPPSLVEFILNEKLPVNNGETNYNVKILDPSCGSGIFLVESFKRLVKRYENKHQKKITDFDTLKNILTNNIFGIEIHSQSIKVAAFSLYLALVDCLDPKTIWQKEKHRLPNLINNPNDESLKEQGKNLYCRDTIEQNEEVESIEFDLIVGNPPFGTSNLSASIKNYCKKNNFAQEMVLPFLHKATLLAPKGEIALIFNTKVLTNTSGTYQNFRKWLFNNCYVEKVYNFSILRNAKKNFGGQLFGGATGPISIVYYQKEQPENPSNRITYYAPKTYVKSSIIEGVSIDYSDLKFLPREECQKPDTKIWKVAMWGGMNDWKLVNRLLIPNRTLKNYLIENQIVYGSGLHSKENEKSKIHIEGKYIDTSKFNHYYTQEENAVQISKEFRSFKANIFKKHIAIVKEGIKKQHILSSYLDYDVFYSESAHGFVSEKKEKIKSLVVTFNSDLANYFLFLTSSSWGIERDKINLDEFLFFPYVELNLEKLKELDFSKINFDRTVNLVNQQQIQFDFEYWENHINECYNLSQEDINRLTDIKLSIDLFHNQEKSVALQPVLENHPKKYAEIIASELNNFLEGQDFFACATTFSVNRHTPLMMIKISFEEHKKDLISLKENIDKELQKIDQFLWEEKANSIYFRKKLNYKKGNDIYIIRPNQRRFWSQSMALEDASELILEILNEN